MENEKQTSRESLLNDDGVSLGDLLQVFTDFRKAIFFSTFSAIILAYLYSFTITPTYLATTLVVAADENNEMSISSGLGGLASLAGIQLDEGASRVQTSIAIFRSRKFIEEYIEDENLLPLLFSNDWDSEEGKWKSYKPTIGSGYGAYKDYMQILPTADLYQVRFETPDPIISAKLANGSIKRLNNYIRNQKIEETERSMSFLQKEIDATNIANAQKFLFSLIEEQTKSKMLASVREEYVFKVIDPAIVPGGIYRPNVGQITFIGGLLGFFFAYLYGASVNIFGLNLITSSRFNIIDDLIKKLNKS
jgi:uncharacterized protein involved in exopolysaccharide biosynthesis